MVAGVFWTMREGVMLKCFLKFVQKIFKYHIMTINQYIESINSRYKLGLSTEHTFRGDLQQLIESILPDVRATNEPKRQACGAPDYILTMKEIPVGYIEAKDIGDTDLDGKRKTGNKEQFDRYKASLPNLIFTDYLNFHLYRDGEFALKITIGEITPKGIKPLTENFTAFEKLIKNFGTYIGQTIKSSKKLAEMMAGKARLLADIMDKALASDEDTHANSTLKDQMYAFKEILIHDIEPKSFADIYAQTVAYGLFAARLHDTSLDSFSRQEAAELIPRTNPFLRRLFQHIAGFEIDDRIKWIVDDLALIFRATDIENILKDYGKSTKTEDPIIHFYETFLSEYDPALRKSRGVWYTPQPVVNFIVRAVDDILKTEFDLPMGLADTSKVKLERSIEQSTDKRFSDNKKKETVEYHKVQILDPATGTGTFLAETLRHIYKNFEGQQGIWSDYVENHLLPRLNGFELLMASYAMAHLKMDLVLRETGFYTDTNQRLRIYLTNSLEEHHPDTGTLWANWLSTEANEANRVKRDTPVMVVIGNPPYSGESANKGEWIMSLMEDYKKEPKGMSKLKEQNSKFINDDYVKFLRYGQHFIEKNGSGVLAFINPHGFLDNPTFRGMRWNLLKTYDKIFIIDLHGNVKKKETSPNGSIDENVFDIQQGVSINLFVKTGKKKANELGKVFLYDLYGKREQKHKYLIDNSLDTVNFKIINPFGNSFVFKDIDRVQHNMYNEGINPIELFKVNVMGFQTHRDNFCIDENKEVLVNRLDQFSQTEYNENKIFKLFGVKSSNDFDIKNAQIEFSKVNIRDEIIKCTYRPFENRYIYFNRVVVDRPRKELVINVKNKENLLLGIGRQGLAVGDIDWCLTTVSKYPVDANVFRRGGVNLFPLYLYPENNSQQSFEEIERIPNLNMEIVNEIAKKLNLAFLPDENLVGDLSAGVDGAFSPLDLLDYIYAVLHSPTYREKYKEFLKIDFPRVPYPKDTETFWQLVELGREIRQIHLMESPVINKLITRYPEMGDNLVDKPLYKNGNVYINKDQYFENVPETAWNFYIGGYQPAQKWLKDRRNRKLSYEDILHYQKIIVALTETDRLMKEIDKIEIE